MVSDMSLKRFGFAFMALFAFFCSGFVTESYINRAIANDQGTNIAEAAKTKVKEIYPEFMKIIKNGAKESEITAFAERNMDTVAISKRFCGASNDKLVKTIIKFLIWRLKTEAIQKITNYSLNDSMQSVVKGNRVEVKCKLDEQSADSVNMTVAFSKNGDKLGKIAEIVILGIPLIEGAKTPMKKYFEANGININKIKNPEERAEKSCEALEDFIKNNGKNTSK